MARWNTELTTINELNDFGKFLGGSHRDTLAQLRVYLNIRKATGSPLALPGPANTYSKGADLLTLEIIHNLIKSPVTGAACPAACSAAWAKTANLPSGRDASMYQAALGQLQAAKVDIGGLTNALRALLPALEQAVDDPYVNDYLANATQREEEARKAKAESEAREKENTRRKDEVAKIRRAMEAQAGKLEGSLKNKGFVYYEHLKVPSPLPGGNDLLREDDVLIIEEGNGAFREFSTGRCFVGTIVDKGTHKLKDRNKYFKFRCTAMTKQQMFDALRNTGWNMKNLRAAADLEQVT
jgi:hypothetical protein